MNSRVLSVVGGITAALLLLVPGVRAQSSPDPKQLQTQAATALVQAGSAHLSLALTEALTGKRAATLKATLDGDVAWKAPAAAHLTGSISATSTAGTPSYTFSTPFELIYANNTLALCTDAQSDWLCTAVQSVKSMKAPATAPLTGTKHSKLTLAAPVLVGPDTVNGVSVWHVQQTGSMTLGKKAQRTLQLTIDEYLAQADTRPARLQVTVTMTGGKQQVNETLSTDFSQYGEAVTVAVPSSCTGSGQSGDYAAALLARSGLPLTLRQLLRAFHLTR